MSHQSGIQVSEDLAKTFADAVATGNTRSIRISIVNESLEATGTTPVESSLEQDYTKITDFFEPATPAYVLVRLDEKDTKGGYNWLFLCYVPDNAKVRDKMLYASTRASLTKSLGDSHFTDSVYGTAESELNWDGYKKHLAHKKADAPLTQRERELAEIKLAEAKAVSDYQGTTTRKTFAPGLTFPMADNVLEALGDLKKSKDDRAHNFVSLYLEKETIELDKAANVPANQVHSTLAADAPRFTFYLLEHNGTESLVFIYTCPSSSKIRERMLYSSSKANVINAADSQLDLKVVKKLETSDIADLTEEYLVEEVSSATNAAPAQGIVGQRVQMLSGQRQGQFSRPMAPGRRRPVANTTTAPASQD
ncbi:ptk9 protein tyrosine kinase 9 [Lichtheimia corymbifera JMRC:FSU:9682]|uniref:Twinfilin n=1 Tax=Lichtheimia corymbifera JMRC:FSU:9682 TaxID=1263082 RepID=A0A068RFG6_9FUNG|nr:ptk9 protein tyrosine kinase 9 [Lichtheimia corymbifera JMRC:FSU:9682]